MFRQAVALALTLVCVRALAEVYPRRDRAGVPPVVFGGAPARGGPRVVRLRVWAARDGDWQARFRRLIDDLDGALARWPGVRFEIVAAGRWERDSAGVELERLLGELETLDSGDGVDAVVGLVAAPPSLPEQLHDLGMARQLGRHLVLRRTEPGADPRQLAILFLHEWAHTLGAIHARGRERIMSPIWDAAQSRFSEVESQLIELALAKKGTAEWRLELARLVEETPDPDWDPRERDQLRRLLPPRAGPLLDEAKAAHLDHLDGRADALLLRAERSLAEGDAAGWRAAAELRRRLGEPTLALEDARRTGDGSAVEMERWARLTRRRALIPDDAAGRGLPPEREGEYLRQLAIGEEALRLGRPRVAAQMALQLERDFPRLPAAAHLRRLLATSLAPGSRRR